MRLSVVCMARYIFHPISRKLIVLLSVPIIDVFRQKHFHLFQHRSLFEHFTKSGEGFWFLLLKSEVHLAVIFWLFDILLVFHLLMSRRIWCFFYFGFGYFVDFLSAVVHSSIFCNMMKKRYINCWTKKLAETYKNNES